jgi:hypothetical protein
MAQLALAAVGSAIGGQVLGTGIVALGMTGNAIGWAVGSLLGGMIGQKGAHTVQPGIGDKSVQASTYGAFQTIIYGTMRVAGNVIDGVTEVREVRTTTRVGKGGPKNTNTTLSWNADVAIDLCQGTVAGIRKIWNAGKLVYDVSTGGSASTIIASSVKATSFKLYDGSETQLADPTLETVHGAGNVPAYRGRAYVVFAALDCPNGQIPQLTFEVSMSVTPSATLPIFTPAVPFEPEYTYNNYIYSGISRVCGPDVVYHMVNNYQAGTGGAYAISVQGFKAGNGYLSKLWTATLADYGTGAYGPIRGMNGSHKTPYCVRSTLGLNATYSTTNRTTIIDMLTGTETVIRSFVPGTVTYDLVPAYAAYDEITGKFIIVGSDTAGRTYERFNPQIYTALVGDVRLALAATSGVPCAFYNNIIYTFDQRAGVTYVQSWNGTTGAYIAEVAGGPATLDCTTFATGQDPSSLVTYNGFRSAISAHAGGVFVYCKTNNKVWRIDTAWREVSSTIANSTSSTEGIEDVYIEQDYIVEGPLVASPDAASHYRVAAAKSFDPANVTVGSAVSDICVRAGLTTGQIDVTALAATMRGYALTRQATARAALEPLLKAYFVDAREEDAKIEFINRADQVSLFDVAYDDLAAAADGGEMGDAMPLARTEEAQMPRSVTVTFIDQEADYQIGTQRAIRQIATAINEQTDELPMAITATRAATVADVLLYDAWSQRNQRSVSLTRAYAAVSPGDLGTFEYPQGTYTLKRVTRVNDTGALVQLDIVDGDAPLYSATIAGVAQNAEQSGLSLFSPTRMALLDIPILRDLDNNNGIYVALSGYTTPWGGAVLYQGNDDASLAIIGSVTTSTSVGSATTLLADWANNTPDIVNTVTVEEAGTLSSSTLDGCLTNGENLCAIGDELLQFVTATYVSAGKYTLSNLIRGRRGTERYKSTHTAFERFVLIQSTGAGILRPDLDIGEIGQTRQYRAITYGLSPDSQVSTPFATTGVALKPFSPVDFKRSALNGASTLTWNRRSRLSGEFPDSTDIALGESAESYIVDIYSDSTFALVVRSLSAVTTTATYTLAQQTTDFGSYQTTLYLRIYQVSALIGRGIALQVTSVVANVNSTPPSLLAHMDGAGTISTPVDSSTYAFTAALTGAAALSTTQSKFSGSSLYSPGTGECGCNFDTSSAAFSFGTGDFTVEFWAYAVAATNNVNTFAISETGALGSVSQACLYLSLNQANGALFAQTYAGAAVDANITSAASAFPIAAWNHVAIARRSSVLYMFINGVSRGTPVASTGSLNYSASMKVMVGGWQLTSSATMYFDEIRITKGEAVYFADFVPPTAAF